MSRLKQIPPQVVRILLLTIFIVASYTVARAFLKPASHGQFGFYRGDALEEVASREPTYAGQVACDECHSDVLLLKAKHEHKTISCEACHGPTLEHVNNPDVKTASLNDSLCLRCHEASVARPAWLKQITPDKHYTGEPCKNCHIPHQPNEVP